jgi:hypothetical protein
VVLASLPLELASGLVSVFFSPESVVVDGEEELEPPELLVPEL